MASADTVVRPADAASPNEDTPRGYYPELFLVSFAGLLLEIGYTRVISFKLFYYYTYFVIGLALLGIGAGAVLVTVSARVRGARTETILRWSLLLGAASVAIGYLIIAVTTPIGTKDANSARQMRRSSARLWTEAVEPYCQIANVFSDVTAMIR